KSLNSKIKPAKLFTNALERFLNFFWVGDVAREQRGIRHICFPQALDVFLQPFTLISKRQTCARFVQRLRRGPGNRALVGDAKDDSEFVLQHYRLSDFSLDRKSTRLNSSHGSISYA